MKKNKKAFTLIEILVTIFIIGIISSFVIVSFSSPRQKSRDIKRISDITQLQIALNNYYQFEGNYPEELTSGESLVGSTTEMVFLETIPENFSYHDYDCPSDGYEYAFHEGTYDIDFCLESPVEEYSLGPKCATPAGILNGECGVCGGQDSIFYQGYEYTLVAIGDQCWFAENLQTDTYNNDIPIPWITENTDWSDDTSGAYCCYDNVPGNCDTYGTLYNWYAVETEKLCPSGWHVPSDNDFKILEGEVDSTYGIEDSEWDGSGYRGDDAGSQLAGDEALWDDGVLKDDIGFGNSGFNALPAGVRGDEDGFSLFGSHAHFWSSSGGSFSRFRRLYSDNSSVYTGLYSRAFGMSIRCLKD